LLLAVWCAAGSAQTYPLKPLRVVVPFAAGGPTDIVARLLAPKLTEVMGQQVVVENRAGANGLIGVDHVAKSAPDGYAMVMTTASPVAISPAVYPKMPFDTLRDFAAVTLATTTPELLVVHPSVPAKSMKELIALARTRRGELNIASTGSGSLPHLALELLKVATKADVTHVPYNGAAPALGAPDGGPGARRLAEKAGIGTPRRWPRFSAARCTACSQICRYCYRTCRAASSARSRWRAPSARDSCPICRR
jgi:tripartite-type tricarboxylate transporter receptor subunit TctC